MIFLDGKWRACFHSRLQSQGREDEWLYDSDSEQCNGFHRPLWWNGAKTSSAYITLWMSWTFFLRTLTREMMTSCKCLLCWMDHIILWLAVSLVTCEVCIQVARSCLLPFRISNVFQRLECEIRWEINKQTSIKCCDFVVIYRFYRLYVFFFSGTNAKIHFISTIATIYIYFFFKEN